MSRIPDDRKKYLAPVLKTFVKVEFLLAFVCVLVERFCKYVLHLHEPYDYPFPTRLATFWDFLLYRNRFQHFHHPDFFTVDPAMTFLYPAPMAVLYEIFFRFHAAALAVFLSFIAGSFLVTGILLGRAMLRRGVSTLKVGAFIAANLLLSYPMWFDFKQGNMEIGVWVVVALGVWAFCKGRGYSAAACFGIAGSMKIFPLVYLGLLLATRKYREVVFAGIAAIAATLISLWLVGSDIPETWRHIQAGVALFRFSYMLHYHPGEIGFDHSAFSLVKCWLHRRGISEIPSGVLNAYLAIAAIAGTALYFLRIRYLPLINQVLCLSVASILLPPVSYDYTLMHLYIPWAMLVLFAQDQWQSGRNVAGLTAVFIALAILVSPESEFIHHIDHVGGQIKALALIALMFLGLKYPFQREDDKAIAHPVAA
jgi:hypothetical protein